MRLLPACLALVLNAARPSLASAAPTRVADVIGAAGGTAVSASFNLTFTIAQPAVGTSTFSAGSLLSGFYFPGANLLTVGDAPRPAVSQLVSIRPNPGGGTAAIAFEIGAGDGRTVRLEILDIQGRRIRTLELGTLAPGSHRVDWRGDDDAGHALPVGVYLARLETASTSSTLRMVRLH